MARSTQPSHHVSFSWILLCAAAIALVIPMAGCVKSKGGGGVTALLEGNITLPGQGVIGAPVGPPSAGPPQASLDINGATVEALDADGNVVTSATTDTFGHYSLRLPSGSYQIRVRVGTTEYFTPLPAPVIARGLEIDGATDVAGTKTLDFEVPAPADTVAGTITAGGNPVSAAIVEFVDAEAEAVRYTATSAADGSFSVPVLPLGRFLARVDAATLPAGFAAPTPINLAVTASGVSPISLAFTLPAAIPVTGAVSTTSGIAPAISLAPDGSPQPPLLVEVPLVVEAGATIIISEIGYGEIARVVVQSDGTFDLNLRDGSYLLEFEGFGNGVVAPPPVRITVKNGLIYTDDQDLPIDPGAGGQIGALAHDVSATLTGSVTRGGSAVVARVVAVNSATGGIVASTDTTETGTYSLPLADGSYSVAVLSTFLPPGVIAPRPVRVGVEAGADPTNPIKEDAGVVDDGIVDFTLTSASVTLAGTVSTTGGTALMDIRVRALKGGEPVAQGVTSADGTYVLQLPLGTVDIEINPESVPPGLLSPDPLRVEVATAAGVTTITGPAGTIASLDWALDARTPNVNGTVRFDFNGDDVLFADEVVGCRIVVIRPDTGEFIFDTPSGPVTGTYSLILKNGTYIIGVDTESLPPGSAPPPAHALSVTDAGVTLADGTAAPAVNVDFTLMRRAATLTGVVVLNGTGTAVGLQLIDLASGTLVTRVGSAPVSGEYRMSMFPGTYEFRVDPDTLPAGTAIPAPVELSVAADGTISTPSGIINSLAVTLTRNVATLTGIVTVTRGGVTAPVEVEVQARDPQDHGILQGVLSDPETGAYTLLLLPGSYAIAIDPASIPPGVLPPPPVVVTVSGTTVSGPGVAGNVLDLTLEDLRQGGVDITGLVFDSGSGNGLFAELRLFDPINGSVDENFILSVASDATGQFSFRAVDGIYRLAILPETLPPTAVPPPGATLSVQGNNIIENNIIYVTNPAENAQNDGIINFEIQDGATSGIRIVGVVAENGNPIPSAFVMVVDAATGDIVAETVTDAAAGSYTLVLPLGGYFLGVHPDSLPFTLIPPPPVSVLATSTGGVTTVTTDGGQVVNPDGNGDYVFDFTPVTASQSLSGTVQNSIGGAERVFLQVLDGYDGSPVTGRWSDIATGGYVIQLSPGSYEVGIDPPSVPFGAVAPPPVAITVTDTGILEANGTPDDGVVDFTILAAGRTISGTVTDSNGNPFACFAGALDALTDEFVQGAPTMPATGAYGFSVPEGTYKVGIDPGSLPPGFLVPPMVTVQVTNVDVTVDFVIDDATQCITGTVVTATGGIPLPAFVFLRDASTDQFITGFPTAPGSGAFDLCAAPGFYELLLDPGSLPPGTIAPPPVAVQVTDLAILEDNTAGAGNVVNDGTVNFLVTDTPINNLAQLTGTVTFQSGGQSFPLGAFVFLEEASTHQFLNGVFSDPGSGGSYSMLVPDGTYQVLVDPGTLPPGVALPPPVLITVSGTTITQQTDGLPVVSSQLDFVLSTAENTISGTVTLAGNGFSCFVIAMDPTTDLIVMGAPVDPQGNWSMGLPDGTYRIKVDPPSLPPGIMAPAGVIVSASSGLIIESAGTANDGIIPFVLTQSQSTLSGYVEDSGGARMYAFVLAFNSVDGQIVAVSPTGPNELFTLPLFDGDFDIVVDPPSLPLDSVPPVPSRVNVSGATITLTNAGSGAIDGNGDLAITVTQQNQAVSVPIAVEDGAGNPMPGAVRVLDSFGNLLFIFGVPPQPGGVPLLLGDGTFVLELEPASVPPGFSLPAPTTVAIAGGIATPANVTFSLSLPLLTGTIFNAVSGGTTLLALDLLNGEGMVLNSGVPLVQSGSDATYQVNLGDGTYLLSFRRANGVGSAQVLVPQPVTVNVAGGVIQNPDSDPVAAGVQIDIDVPQIMGTAAGTVTLNGGPISGLVMRVIDPVNNRVVNGAITDANGDYLLALPAGFCKLRPAPDSLNILVPTAIPPDPYEVLVTTGGDLSVVGDVNLCPGGGPAEACTGLDFTLTEFNGALDALVTGTVEARQNPNDPLTPVAGAQVLLVDGNGAPLISVPTDANGSYSIIVPDGIFYILIDPGSLNLPYPTVPSTPVQLAVAGTTVTEDDTTGTGNAIDDGTVNFILEGATALVHGTVMTDTGMGVGALLVISTADQTEFPEDFAYVVPSEPNGNYFLPIGPGNFKLWVDPGSLPPGFLPPPPTVFLVSGNAVTENDTAGQNNQVDDGIINPVVTSGGGSILGQVLDNLGNGVPAFVGLLVPAANPNDPPMFVTGSPTDPASGSFLMTASDGSYFLEVDPFSLPPGLQAPPRVQLSITTVNGTPTVTYEPTAETTVINGDTVVILRVTQAANEIRGTLLDDQGQPVPAAVVVEDVTNQAFVNMTYADPVNGEYHIFLGDGVFDVMIDPWSLPPGAFSPPPVRVTIAANNVPPIVEGNTVGVDPNDGITPNAADDGVVNFVLGVADALLSGYVRDPLGNGVFAQVGLFTADVSGDYTIFVGGAPADYQTGFYEIPISDGTYQVKLDPGSVPPGLLPPPPVVISVAGGVITFPATAQTEIENTFTRLILVLQQSDGGVAGSVTDTSGAGVPIFVIAEDATTYEFMGGAQTDSQGNYSIALPSGTFRIFVDSFGLPQGAIPPGPQQVTVTNAVVQGVDFVIDQATLTFNGYVLLPGVNIDLNNPNIDCSAIANNADVTPVGCSVVLVIPSQDPNTPPTFLTETFTSPSDGFFSLPLGSGNYEVHVNGGTLPMGMMPPPPLSIIVSGGAMNLSGEYSACTNDPTESILFVSQGASSIAGVVEDDNGVGVGAFVELVDATSGNFVGGTPTNPMDGTFSLTLGDLNYELRVDPGSVPPGLLPPPPVGVSVVGGVVSVDPSPGVTWQGNVLTITLSSASAAVSGTVTDANANPFSAMVMAFDSSNNFVAGIWSSPADGSYNLPLIPGVYEMQIDSFSLPPGFTAPASQTVNLIQNPQATANFTLTTAAATFTGQVYYLSGGQPVGVPAYVEVVDSATGNYITGSPADPDPNGNYVYSVGVGVGSYRVGVAPGSTPPGFVAPPPVVVTVTINAVTGLAEIQENAHGNDNNLTDGIIDFELQQAGATLNGRLVADDGQGGFYGVFGYIRVELADGSHAVVAETPTDGDGYFSLSFTDGTFELFVDAFSLPPGFLPPPPSTLTVAGSSIQVDGAPVVGTYQIEVFQTAVSLSGLVLLDGVTPVQGAWVFVVEADTHMWVGGSSTLPDGSYQFPLVDGTFLVQVDSYSLPPGVVAPPPVQISVQGTTITQDGQVITSLDISVGQADATITVNAFDSFGNPIFAQVEVFDASGQFPVANVPLNGTPAQISLPAGSFLVMIPPYSVPPGLQSPPPVSLTVAPDGSTTDSSGAPGDGYIEFILQPAAATINGNVSFLGSPVAGAFVIAIDEQQDFGVADTFTDAQGTYFLDLPVGDFEIRVEGGLPTGAVPPAPAFVHVFGGGGVDPSGPIDFVLLEARGTVTGTVLLNGSAAQGFVGAFVDVLGQWEEANNTMSAPDGTFNLPLGAGDFVVLSEVDRDLLPNPNIEIISPLPVALTVPDTLPPTNFNQDFAFWSLGDPGAPASQILTGSITAGGSSYDAPVGLWYQGQPMALTEALNGTYRMAIMADQQRTFDVGIFQGDLPQDYSAPPPVSITVDGTGITGAGVTQQGGEYILDFDITVAGIALHGTVTDWNATAIAGVEIRSEDAGTGNPGPLAITDATGAYSLILPAGNHELELGIGLPSGAVRPAIVAADVVDTGGGVLALYIDGQQSADGLLDWQLARGEAHLTGQLTVDGMPASGEIIAFAGVNEVTFGFASGGTYDIYLPAGDLTIVAELDTYMGNLLVPPPYNVTVQATGTIEELTHNFPYVSPGGPNPSQMVSGQVMSNGASLAATIVISDQAGLIYAFADTGTGGFWQVTLPPGTYQFSVENDDIPVGYTGTASATLVVTANDVSGPGYIDGMLNFVLNTQGTTVSGTVTDPSASPVAGVYLYFLPDMMNDVTAFAVTDAQGQYQMVLADGFYEAELDLLTLPQGTVVPAIEELDLMGSPVTLDFALVASVGTASGTVLQDGVGADAELVAVDVQTLAEVTFAYTALDGSYTMPLPAGDFAIMAELDMGSQESFITPDPLPVTIAPGSALTGIDFDFVNVANGTAQVLIGRLLDGVAVVWGEVLLTKDIGGQLLPFAFVETWFDGIQDTLRVALSPGNYQVQVIEAGDQQPVLAPIDLVVTANDISSGGQVLPGNQLDIQTQTGLHGRVLSAGSSVAGLDLLLVPAAGAPITTTTDIDGRYTFDSPPDGEYTLQVDVTTLPPGSALPRPRSVFVTPQAILPSKVKIGLHPSAGDLSGVVSVDGAGAPATVHVLDRSLESIASIATDPGGNYLVPLAAGSYTVMAILAAPTGTEVPAVIPEIAFTGNATQNIDFTTATPSQVLTGTYSLGGQAASVGILAAEAAGTPVGYVNSDGVTGAYQLRLPYGNFLIMVDPTTLTAAIPAPEPTAIVVDANGVSGVDPDGNPIAGNQLDLDPFGASDPGQVRLAVSNLAQAVLARDTVQLGNLLDDVATLWDGRDKAQILQDWPQEEEWTAPGRRFDNLVVSVSSVTADEWDCWIVRGREFSVGMDGTAREDRWDATATQSPSLLLTVLRAGVGQPWLIAGNGLSVMDAFLEHGVMNVNSGGVDTPEEMVELAVEEGIYQPILSASVAGAGIVDGTLSEQTGPDGDEWIAMVDAMGGSPPPFSATLGGFIDGSSYAFTVNLQAGGTDNMNLLHNAPQPGLYPTVSVSTTSGGKVLIDWEEISAQLLRPAAEVAVEIMQVQGMGDMTIFEEESLPVGRSWLKVYESLFTSGQTYRFEVYYLDVGGGIQAYAAEMQWP